MKGRSAGRQRARLNHVRRVNAALSSLNYLAGFKVHCTIGNGFYQPAVADIVARVEGLVKLQSSDPDALPPRAAFRELLKGRTGYQDGGGCASSAPYQPDRVSFPESVREAPFVADLLPDVDRIFWKVTPS